MRESGTLRGSPGRRGFLGGLLVILLGIAPLASGQHWEIDATALVTRVIDGDTFDADPVGRVQLADIDTPEVGEPGAGETNDYLTSLVHRRWVYLDVDDLRGRDVYGRVIAVVYVRYNATHLLNVNKAVLRVGLAEVADFPNEFDLEAWTLYAFHPDVPGPTGEVSLSLWAVVVGVILLGAYFFAKHFRS